MPPPLCRIRFFSLIRFTSRDTLAFQVDLWSARGDLPRNFVESEVREKDILFSSQTRMATDQFKKVQILRRATAKLLAKLPT